MAVKYLYVPPHGSPNTELLADTVQLFWLLQLDCTVDNEADAEQAVLLIAEWMHVTVFDRPYVAAVTVSFFPVAHERVRLYPSQTKPERLEVLSAHE